MVSSIPNAGWLRLCATQAADGVDLAHKPLVLYPVTEEVGNGMAGTDETTLRLRRQLDGFLEPPHWPKGIVIRTLLPTDAAPVHHLLQLAYVDQGGMANFATWWEALKADAEFDPSLCFLALDENGRLLGVAQCWTSAFIKDLAVHPDARRRGIGENLLRHAFGVFRNRGAAHVELKVDLDNLTAQRLYERAGMRRVPLSG
jgi:ribosomal protein S18 acetylase RimI-like enzyme